MGQGETSKDRAMRLLALVRERTEHTQQPVVVTDLVVECRLSLAEAQAAWKYLADHHLIDKFGIPYTAQINAKGIDLLDSRAAAHSGEGDLKAGSSTATGFARRDSAEDLARAVEVSKELARLRAFLPNLTDAELSAYSTKSLSIGTFLQSKEQTFSVLTEDMLADAFKQELDRRKETRFDRWLKGLKNNRVIAIIMVVALATGGIVAFFENVSKLPPIVHPSSTPAPNDPLVQLAGFAIDSPLVIVTNATTAAVGALGQFNGRFSTSDESNARQLQSVEKEQLKHVIIALVSISHSQAPLPALLREYVHDYPSTALWGQITHVISENTSTVNSLVGTLKQFDGDLVYKDLKTYTRLSDLINSRAGLYSALSNMPPPTSPAELQNLTQLANNFDQLIEESKQLQQKLANYLKEK